MASTDLWYSVTTSKNVIDKWFVISEAIDLFGEAIKSFCAHANLACCMCVRASMETLLHIMKTTPRLDARSASRELALDTKWPENFKWAQDNGLIDKAFAKRIEIARSHGNLGAHLAQRIDRAYYEQPRANRPLEPIQLRVSDESAWNDLVTCRDLILKIATERWKQSE